MQSLGPSRKRKRTKEVQNALEAEIAADMERQGLTQTGNDVCIFLLKQKQYQLKTGMLASTHSDTGRLSCYRNVCLHKTGAHRYGTRFGHAFTGLQG